jgi:hypothetical protein
MKSLVDYVGIPYAPRGKPPVSADCWSLIADYAKTILAQEWPPYLYDTAHYMTDARRIIAAHILEPGACWELAETPKHGDVLIYKLKGFPVHCAVCLDKGLMLHTMRGRNSTIEPQETWRENLVAIFRWKGTP